MPLELGQQLEVMEEMKPVIQAALKKYLKTPDSIWQPSDMLPAPDSEEFLEEIGLIRETAKAHSEKLLAVLVGDAITEEALPTYTAWLLAIEGVGQADPNNPFTEWFRRWTAEEKGHGTTLDRWMYLSGRIDTREVEISTKHLIADGFDNRASQFPYHNMIYTSFQELATNRSHRNVAKLARQSGDGTLAKMCGTIASDEKRHANAYIHFAKEMFEKDPDGMMMAFRDMMEAKIVMPAELLRESGGCPGDAYEKFSAAAQELEVYTSDDYIGILEFLIKEWDVENIEGLTPEGREAQGRVLKILKVLKRANRTTKSGNQKTKPDTPAMDFKWVIPS